MSYDVSLEIDTGRQQHVVEEFNHTSNTAQMWREAGCNLAAYDGVPARWMVQPLARAITEIQSNRDHYLRMEPENGWGTVESTVKFLTDLWTACVQHPSATVRVCR